MKNQIKFKFKDGITITVIKDDNKSINEIKKEAIKVYKQFVVDSTLKRTFNANTSFASKTTIDKLISKRDYEELDYQIALLKRDMEADINHTEYVNTYSRTALLDTVKKYKEFIDKLSNLDRYTDTVAELNGLLDKVKETFMLNDARLQDAPQNGRESVRNAKISLAKVLNRHIIELNKMVDNSNVSAQDLYDTILEIVDNEYSRTPYVLNKFIPAMDKIMQKKAPMYQKLELAYLLSNTILAAEGEGVIKDELSDSEITKNTTSNIASEDPAAVREMSNENKFGKVNRAFYSGPTVSIQTDFGFSITDYERAVRHNDNMALKHFYDKIIDSLNEDINDPDRVEKFSKKELREVTNKYYNFVNDYTAADLDEYATNIKQLTDKLYKVWHLGV